MSEILFEALPVADATAFARQLAAREAGGLAQFVPNRNITGFRTRAVRVSRTTQAAKFRSFDAETPIGKRPVAATVQSVELAPLGQKLPLRESEILHRWLTSGELTGVIEALYDDTENNVASILNRAEQLRGEFLFTGAVSIEENGFIQEADYGLDPSHNLTVGDLSAPWDQAGSNALDEELEWIEQVQDETGETVTALITSSRVARAMRRNGQYVAFADNGAGLVTPARLNEIRREFNLPPVFVYDGKVGGERVTPDDRIALVTAGVGEFQWGDTVEGLELLGSNAVDEISVQAPKIVASAWKSTDPVNLWSKANSTALPVAGDINGLFVAQVLSEDSPES